MMSAIYGDDSICRALKDPAKLIGPLRGPNINIHLHPGPEGPG